MSSTLLKNAGVVFGNEIREDVSIRVANEVIETVGGDTGSADDVIDCSGLTVLPGFIDVHIHGAVGVDVNSADADALFEMARFLAANGVTAWMPTLVPDSDDNYASVIGAVNSLMEFQTNEPVAQAVGIHYEGVFANEHMCGALRPAFFKKYTASALTELPRLARGVHMTTFAPEIDGGIELTRELTAKGWIASMGHTRAEPLILDDAVAAGAKHLTHFYNAMTGMHHRNLGVVGWALANPHVTFDIIADGVHVHPAMLEFACRSKTPDRVSLISDSVAPAGLGDGEFEIWGERVSVESGQTRNERGSIAGSVITMLDAVKRMRSLGFSWSEVSRMASRNPAKLLGIEATHGSIEAGKRSDLVAVDADGNVRFTMVGGRVAFADSL